MGKNQLLVDIESINNITDMLVKYWNSLCKKYNVDVEFNVVKTATYVRFKKTDRGSKMTKKSMSQILEMLENDNSCMHTEVILCGNNETNKTFVFCPGVFLLIEKYLLILSEYGDDIDGVTQYFKTMLLHQMGHILVEYELYNDKDIDDSCKLRNDMIKNRAEVKKKLRDNADKLTKEEYNNIYYNEIIGEKMANDKFGLTSEDFIIIK